MTTNATPGGGMLTFNVGPHHSAAIGPLRMRVETDGDVVMSSEPDVGYLHRGIEKLAERMTWTGFMPYTDRVDYLSAIHCNLAYAMAVEKLAAITVPERAACIRVLVGELNRIGSHLLSLGHLASLLGAETALMYSLRDRERINNLFEMLSGARLTYSYVRIGGVAADVTEGFIEKTYEFVEYLLPKLKEYHDLLSNNRIFVGRLSNVGAISASKAIDCGLTGPVLRAAGVKYDTRKMQPYSNYHQFDFDVPTGRGESGTAGDAFDRYVVRMREIEQSVSIIKQALDALPEGPFNTTLPRLFKAPKGEAYAVVESPRGAFGVYVASNGDKNPTRVRFRTPSFAALNLFPEILREVPLSDVATIIASLDIMVSEVESMNSELATISPMAAYVGSFLDAGHPAWLLLLAGTMIYWFALLLPPVALMAYLDRKLGSDIQMRIGPNRVSAYGIFQFVADTLKQIFKQDTGPEAQEGWIFRWGTVAAIVCVFVAAGNVPMAESWALANLDSGAITVLIALCFSNLCLFWAAYSANSQWSVLSAFRVISLVVSYIVPLAIALIPPILIAGSPNFDVIVRAQGGFPWKWFVFHNPATLLSCAAMYLALLIWQARGPFDHHHARGEIAGGLAAEYSGLRRGLLTFLEYVSLLLACSFLVTVYFGGWQTPFGLESFGRAANVVQWLVMMAKIFTLVFVSIWIRWSLPTLRVDQIVSLSWRILVPLGLFGSAVTAVWLVAFHGKGIGDFL